MKLLISLCRANKGILEQKLGLMEVLLQRHGIPAAHEIYHTTCPIVKASIGQHIRHSLDHIEPVIRAALNDDCIELHYDRRERGRTDENNWDAAHDRIQKITGLIEDLTAIASTSDPTRIRRPIDAMFMLSGNSESEFRLKSTVARELGFAAHHAIHHLAMVKIIATNDVGQLNESDLPPNFGRAPSTVNFDRSSE